MYYLRRSIHPLKAAADLFLLLVRTSPSPVVLERDQPVVLKRDQPDVLERDQPVVLERN
jgi:hypothetical protein